MFIVTIKSSRHLSHPQDSLILPSQFW
jgi:hypothetical protein